MTFLKKLFKITCKDTSPLISEMMDHELSFQKKWRLHLHLTMCQMCRLYQNQLILLQKLANHVGETGIESKTFPTLKEEAKQKIKKSL
ncbi:MAG: zf-HC2 domain-containing protein [Nitrospinales bacterium]